MNKPKVILVNLDDNDFIRAYFFQRHLLRTLSEREIDSALFSAMDLRQVFSNISGPPIMTILQKELLYKDLQGLHGIPTVFNENKEVLLKRLGHMIRSESPRALIFNSFEPLLCGFFKDYARFLSGSRVLIYDPHKLARMQAASLAAADRTRFGNITLFTDAHVVEPYYRYGFVPRNIKSVNLVLDEDYFRLLRRLGPMTVDPCVLFSGGDSARDYGALEKIAQEMETPYVFVSSFYKKLRIDRVGRRSPYLIYWRYHLQMANSKIVVISLKKHSHPDSGITNIVAAHALGKPVIINRTGMTARYVRHGKNGFLFDDHNEIKRYVARLLNDPKLHRRMCAEARRTFLKHNSLADLTGRIVKEAGRAG